MRVLQKQEALEYEHEGTSFREPFEVKFLIPNKGPHTTLIDDHTRPEVASKLTLGAEILMKKRGEEKGRRFYEALFGDIEDPQKFSLEELAEFSAWAEGEERLVENMLYAKTLMMLFDVYDFVPPEKLGELGFAEEIGAAAK